MSSRAGGRAGKHRLFLDANVLFSAAYRAGSGLERLWSVPSAVLLTASYAIEEARRNLAAPEARERLERLIARVEIVADVTEGPLPAAALLPTKDRPILLSALAAGATHLITGDRAHFGRYFGMQLGGLLVERPGDYFRREHPREA